MQTPQGEHLSWTASNSTAGPTPEGAFPSGSRPKGRASPMERDPLHHNPHLKKPVLAILGLLEEGAPQRRSELERNASQKHWSPAYRHAPAAVVDILVRQGALTEQTYVDGEPYPGTLEDAQADQNLPDDSEAWTCVSLTPAGTALRTSYAPSTTVRALFDERPCYADVFQAALWACSAENGCTRADLETQIAALAPTKNGEPGGAKAYPQYFIDELETAGAIAWQAGTWQATEAGLAAMER